MLAAGGAFVPWSTAFARALEWRLIATCIDMIVVYAFTRQVVITLQIGSVSGVVRTILQAIWLHYRGHK